VGHKNITKYMQYMIGKCTQLEQPSSTTSYVEKQFGQAARESRLSDCAQFQTPK